MYLSPRTNFRSRDGRESIFKRHRHRAQSIAAFDPNQLNQGQIFLRELYKIVLLISQIDPFSIYKKDNYAWARRQRYHIYQSSNLQIKPSHSREKMKQRLRWLSLTLCGYLSFKFICTCLVQLASDKRFKINRLGDFSKLGHGMTIRGLFANFVVRYAYLIGNPLKSMLGISLFLYLSVVVALVYGFVVIPHIQSTKPFDAITLRFMLDPLRELRRIDMVIEEQLQILLEENPRSSNRLVLTQVPFIHKMRPANYHSDWFFELYHYSLLGTILATGAALIMVLSFVPILLYASAQQGLCKKPKTTAATCSVQDIWHEFSKQDLVALVELHIGLCLAFMVFSNQIALMAHSLIHQLRSTASMRQDLKQCLFLIIAHFSKSRHLRRFTLLRRFRGSGGRVTQEIVNPPSKSDEHLLGVSLLRTLVKLLVTKDELRRNANFVSQIVESFLSSMGVSLVLALLGERLDDLKIVWLRSVIIITIWMALNLVLLVCANAFARIIDLQRVSWSILARLEMFNEPTHSAQVRIKNREASDLDAIVSHWRKFICSGALSDLRNSVRPFKMSITYRRAIRLNFLIISFASLVKHS